MMDNKPAVVVALIAGFVLGLVAAWLYWVQREEVEAEPSEIAESERLTLEPASIERSWESAVEAEAEPDDLTRVEGIGPKMSSLLAEAGIVTFEQLARSDPAALRQILREHGLSFADPGTWPEQAALAAVGAWDALDELQRELSGGRRVG
jgi:predicted flap endonuclease-1-like 5' DNA nuclease